MRRSAQSFRGAATADMHVDRDEVARRAARERPGAPRALGAAPAVDGGGSGPDSCARGPWHSDIRLEEAGQKTVRLYTVLRPNPKLAQAMVLPEQAGKVHVLLRAACRRALHIRECRGPWQVVRHDRHDHFRLLIGSVGGEQRCRAAARRPTAEIAMQVARRVDRFMRCMSRSLFGRARCITAPAHRVPRPGSATDTNYNAITAPRRAQGQVAGRKAGGPGCSDRRAAAVTS